MRYRIHYSIAGERHACITSDHVAILRRVLDDPSGQVIDLTALPPRPGRTELELLGVHPDVATSVAARAPSMGDGELARWARDRAADVRAQSVSPSLLARSDLLERVHESWCLVSALASTGKLVRRADGAA